MTEQEIEYIETEFNKLLAAQIAQNKALEKFKIRLGKYFQQPIYYRGMTIDQDSFAIMRGWFQAIDDGIIVC